MMRTGYTMGKQSGGGGSGESDEKKRGGGGAGRGVGITEDTVRRRGGASKQTE